ncbi:hypothetical protein JAAARDRAFT_62671 [Jaapia argillacea MUCL 33604]|uniref:F-box domain-containing protein n=1 Tax=Jaapia argillacea MUCL 33604 TaxID=933084 RepID=A0A067PBQ7_9AGAM|nr:hypothetical protein JAAARDRAFT_62671 [Jaapia argillacea MUCL 33604]
MDINSLPLELVERIIDHVARDGILVSLCSCALTCRAWRFRAEYYLFHTITINEKTIQTRRLESIFRHSPHLANFVRRLEVHTWDKHSPILELEYPSLVLLQVTLPWTDDTQWIFQTLTKFSSVSELSLLYCRIVDFSALLLMFPHLTLLDIFGGYINNCKTEIRHRSDIRTLGVQYLVALVLSYMMDSFSFPNLQHLFLNELPSSELSVTKQFLRVTGSSLEEFSIHLRGVDYAKFAYDIEHFLEDCPRLKLFSVRFNTQGDLGDLDFIDAMALLSPLLSHLPSTSLREVQIRGYLGLDNDSASDRLRPLDFLVSDPRFRGLEKLVIVDEHERMTENLIGQGLRDLLPLWKTQGIYHTWSREV